MPLTAVLALGLVAACSKPRNIAMTENPLGMGAVHDARLEAIFPIFVPGGLVESRYSSSGSSAGELLATHLFEDSRRIDQLTQLTGSVAEAATGAYEERYNGGICQYFLRTSDAHLIDIALDSDQDEDYENFIEELEYELDDLNYESAELTQSFEDSLFDFEIASAKLTALLQEQSANSDPDFGTVKIEIEQQVIGSKDQIETLRALLENNQDKIDALERRLKVKPAEEVRLIAVNNPCRNFTLGERILVVSVDQGTEFILQPAYSQNPAVNP